MESDGQGFGEHRFDEHGHGEHQEHHGHEGHREHDEHREHEEHREHHEHQDGQGQKHLLFVSKPSGYELIERDGEPPSVGSAVDLGDRSQHVLKVGPSPLPGDRRPCAYLQG